MKRSYQTQQKKQLIHFLSVHKEEQFTIEEIVEKMPKGHSPAKSSVYRLMKQLVEEGQIRRYVKENSRQFLYQFIDREECSMHLHLKCLECGKLIHLSEFVSRNTQKEVEKEAGFDIDQEKTILVGRCEACKKQCSKDSQQ